MSLRKTSTPRWLSITRKIMIYIGGATFLPMLFGKIGIKDVEFALQCWLGALGLLQLYIDSKYKKEQDVYKA
jgi:hypothetical protein